MRTPARLHERRYAAALGALALVGGLLLATPASAVPTCAFDPITAIVTIAVGDGESAVISQTGGAITLDGTPCDVATVTNTDTIDVNGSAGTPVEISIDLSFGDFVPGLTPESDSSSEIEFTFNLPNGTPTLRVTGGPGNDNLIYGTGGINLNATENPGDVDVAITGTPLVVLDGNAGNDGLSVAGGAGTGAPAAGSLNGGGEDDLLGGGLGGSTATGGDGLDTIDYSAASQLVVADLSTGVVEHTGGQTDQLSSVENLVGSPGADAIIGDDGPNVLQGGPGDDLVIGGGGDDTLSGGDGRDTLAFGLTEEGVEVDLRDGTSVGEGNDSLAGFENVIGTGAADTIHADGGVNLVEGGRGSDEIFGHDGTDDLRGNQGNDQLFGQKGNDNVNGGPGRDQLDGGQGQDRCRGGPDPDAFVFCEVIRLG